MKAVEHFSQHFSTEEIGWFLEVFVYEQLPQKHITRSHVEPHNNKVQSVKQGSHATLQIM